MYIIFWDIGPLLQGERRKVIFKGVYRFIFQFLSNCLKFLLHEIRKSRAVTHGVIPPWLVVSCMSRFIFVSSIFSNDFQFFDWFFKKASVHPLSGSTVFSNSMKTNSGVWVEFSDPGFGCVVTLLWRFISIYSYD